ncbi:MAG TPA: ATP-binding protein [bacterium]|nr:ATP-binding protein [bacterium]
MSSPLEESSWHLLEYVPDATLIVDREGRILFVNSLAQKLFGYGPGELVGQAMEVLIPQRFRERHVHHRKEYAHGPKPRPMGAGLDLYGVRKDGTEFPTEISLSPIQTGDSVRVMAAIRDVTDSRLKERLATLGHLAGSIAHELRNPLATIDSSVYFLKAKLKDADPKVAEHLSRIKSAVTAATSVIQSLLDLTRMKPPLMSRVDVAATVDEAVAAIKDIGSIDVVRDYPAEGAFVPGDSQQLLMAFGNVAKNAVDAMKGKGRLVLSVRKTEPHHVEISFSDTGPGIPEENLDRIFQPLFSTKATGIGFGLSIAKMVTDRHEGSIRAHTEPGKGATFVLRFPLYREKTA